MSVVWLEPVFAIVFANIDLYYAGLHFSTEWVKSIVKWLDG